jgi:hypothetical protein
VKGILFPVPSCPSLLPGHRKVSTSSAPRSSRAPRSTLPHLSPTAKEQPAGKPRAQSTFSLVKVVFTGILSQ